MNKLFSSCQWFITLSLSLFHCLPFLTNTWDQNHQPIRWLFVVSGGRGPAHKNCREIFFQNLSFKFTYLDMSKSRYVAFISFLSCRFILTGSENNQRCYKSRVIHKVLAKILSKQRDVITLHNKRSRSVNFPGVYLIGCLDSTVHVY